MRHTSGHTRNRRSHHALKGTNIVTDKESGALRLPHRLDETTGMYRGKKIVEPRAKPAKGGSASGGKGVSTPAAPAHEHDHSHKHENAEVKGSKGFLGKIVGGARPKARSGMGGVAGS